MKKLILLLATAFICSGISAQDDSVKIKKNKDTIRVGGIVIVKSGKGTKDKDVAVKIGGDNGRKKRANISTNWLSASSSIVFSLSMNLR